MSKITIRTIKGKLHNLERFCIQFLASVFSRKVKVKNFVNREDRFIYNVVGTLQGNVEPGKLILSSSHLTPGDYKVVQYHQSVC